MILTGKTNEYLIALGSNIESRISFITQALDKIQQRCGSMGAMGSLLESAPLGPSQHQFLNTAIHLYSDLSPAALLDTLQKIESELGRTRTMKWADRTIDLDIILWRNKAGICETVATENLLIPHPEFINRDFVLLPCSQIEPNWLPPGDVRTLKKLYDDSQEDGRSKNILKLLTTEVFFPIHPSFADSKPGSVSL